MAEAKRFLGITVMSPYYQNEGVEQTIRNLMERAGATAVATNTSVAAPAPDGVGSFQPPDDAGASVRLFDRPMWGKQALWMQSAPGHRARRDFFADSPYQPRPSDDLTDREGHFIHDFIRASKSAGLKVYIQTGAAQPPGMVDEDIP